MFTVWEIIGAGVGVGFAAVILPYICLCILGFTCGGVRGGSFAAGVHSGIGDVEAGSCFACCQSSGAGGMSCCCQFFLFLIGFVTTVTLMAVYNPEDIGPTLEPLTIIPTNFSQLISTTTPLPQLM